MQLTSACGIKAMWSPRNSAATTGACAKRLHLPVKSAGGKLHLKMQRGKGKSNQIPLKQFCGRRPKYFVDASSSSS